MKRYVRDLEDALIATVAAVRARGGADRGRLTGVWLERPPRKIASIGVHVSRWVTTHGYALNVDLDPAPFTEWITACGLEEPRSRRWRASSAGRSRSTEVVPHAVAALAEVFGLALEQLPAEDGAGLWAQPVHERLAARA